MKLKFTHKTWYFFLLCAAAASMLNGFAVLGGMDFSFLEMVAFCITGITILFLAAEKGSDPKDKLNYFGVFVVLMLSYVINGWAAYICSALVWPALLALEYQKGRPIQRQLQLVGAAEAFKAYGKKLDNTRVTDVQEISGHGVITTVDGHQVAAGNDKLMKKLGIEYRTCDCGKLMEKLFTTIQGAVLQNNV